MDQPFAAWERQKLWFLFYTFIRYAAAIYRLAAMRWVLELFRHE